uniref:UvrD-like helicase ATP-binding domain-containing protein n=3 Tax=Amphora coffeiformis TaxID=265554 RepID=A0A7S3L325_9STRA
MTNDLAVTSVKLTGDVLKWLKSADARFRGLFVKKVSRLTRGERSHKLTKGLEGCQSKIFETYLENKSGHRILWTQRPDTGILIWYVCAHKKVSRYAGLIDNSEKRSSRPLTEASRVLALETSSVTQDAVFETGTCVLLDPKRHVPLKLYEVQNNDMKRLANTNWRPSLYLTPREREIVETQGTVCVLGRSGTGKTVTISNRIHYDRHAYRDDPTFSQLFIARSRKVCNYVKKAVGEDTGVTSTLAYFTYEKFLVETEDVLGVAPMNEAKRHGRMDFQRFKREFFKDGVRHKIDPLVAWTQIRSFIKGSIQSFKHRRPLTREEYLRLGGKENRLKGNLRKIAYDIYEKYQSHMKQKKLWDDTDRVASIVSSLYEQDDARIKIKRNRLYVDEIQDFTQAEVALFFLCCEQGRLFLAGDPAQAVEEGVDFRFEDVRIVAYQMVDQEKFRPSKPKLLRVNFRSHAGVLNLAAGVLEIMFQAFPGSAKELPKDKGLFHGPRPVLFAGLDKRGLRALLEKQAGAVILAMHDVTVKHLQNEFGEEATVLSIRDSKGLEFDHVILVDFFSGLHQHQQRSWKDMINKKGVDNPELELQLKQLYTAVTRCCKRFIIAESEKTKALDTFLKWATHRRSHWLVEEQSMETVVQTVVTRDEWLTRGLVFASRAEEETDFEEQEKWLEKSLVPFGHGGDEKMKERVQTHLRSLRIRKISSQCETAAGLDLAQTSEHEMSILLKALTEAGLGIEAAKLCHSALRVMDDSNEAEMQLISDLIIDRLPKPEDR